MTDACIFDHIRTPRGKGKADGALHGVAPVWLAAGILGDLAARSDLDPARVDDVIMGIVMPIGEQGQCLPRIAALTAGWGDSVAGVQVNRFCGSGLEACNMAAAKVSAGQADLIVAGGVESMSRVPILSDGGPWGTDPEIAALTGFVPQGISADLIASKWGYSREMLDGYAAQSHARAHRAWAEGRFTGSIAPVRDRDGALLLARDETIRPEASVETLGQLRPSFEALGRDHGYDAVALRKYPEVGQITHLHHAGNSSGIVDGACAVLIGSPEAGRAAGLRPRARIRAAAVVGSEPTIMLTGPSFAAEAALKRAGMSAADIDLYEVNEAFAAVVLRFIDAMAVDPARVNVNGGAIAMGHPLGATGAMILGTALDELERQDLNTALITLCVGAGMGIATIIERI